MQALYDTISLRYFLHAARFAWMRCSAIKTLYFIFWINRYKKIQLHRAMLFQRFDHLTIWPSIYPLRPVKDSHDHTLYLLEADYFEENLAKPAPLK